MRPVVVSVTLNTADVVESKQPAEVGITVAVIWSVPAVLV